MATGYSTQGRITKNTDNYCGLSILIFNGCTHIMRVIFLRHVKSSTPTDHPHSPWTVDEFLLANKSEICSKLRAERGELPAFVPSLLFPSQGATNLEKWDIGLFSSILLNVCNYKAQQPLSMYLNKMRKVRNHICHRGDASVTNDEFDLYFDQIKICIEKCCNFLGDKTIKRDMSILIDNVEHSRHSSDYSSRFLNEWNSGDDNIEERKEQTSTNLQDLVAKLETFEAALQQLVADDETMGVKVDTMLSTVHRMCDIPSQSKAQIDIPGHFMMSSSTNGAGISTPTFGIATLAVTKPRVHIAVPHDGRILDITGDFVKQFTEDTNYGDLVGEGAYATVYRSNVKVPNMDINIVIKKICCKTGGDFNEPKRRSATNEIIAARLMHYAIVPLLGMWEDIDHTMYFLFPFLEKGDLFTAIDKDMSNIENKVAVCLEQYIRLRIIYQIASAMEFIHTKVEAFRGVYVHGDITSRNIVLDGNLNARLTDFGLARELADKGSLTMTLSEQFGTRGYFLTANMQELTVRRDCYSFGVVLLELLTSLKPVEEETGEMLREKKSLLVYQKDQIEAVWKDPRVYPRIHKIAQDCLNIKTEYSSGRILRDLKELTRNKFFVTDEDKFAEGELANQPKCHVCMLNPAMTRDYQGNHGTCTKLRVCVACLRNSYFNPIKCHTCENDVRSPIGNGWGAILVAGNDEDVAQMATVFEEDLKLIYKTISSKYPHIMGISEKFIQRVSPSKPGTEESMTEQFKAAFEVIRSIPEIHTLLFFFSGHYTKETGFRLGSRTDSVTREEVTHELINCKDVKKRIIFIDCCDAPVFDNKAFPKDTTLQLNACDESNGEKSRVDNNCSPFVRLLVQGMWRKAWPKCCYLSEAKLLGPPGCNICKNYKESHPNDHLISFADLQDYVGKHMKYIREKQTPVKHVDAKCYTQNKVAYCIDKRSEREFYFRHDLHECDTKGREVVYTCDSLPDSVQALRQDLMKEFRLKDPSACRLPGSLNTYSDVICVVMTLGPKSEHYRELDTIPKIAAAWNGKRRLHYGFRKLKNLQQGRVGQFLQTESTECARTIHSLLAAVGVKEPQGQSNQHDVITIERDQIVEIHGVLKSVSYNEEKRRSLKRLLHILEVVDQHTESGGLLYFTFPYQTDTDQPNEHFMVVEHRTPSSHNQA